MNQSRLLGAAVLYGAADVVVLAIGGVLLLPMYTRTLSQADFGIYVIVKANAEIVTYLLYFGMPSAVARLYFDYRRVNEHLQYLTSIVNFFLFMLLAFCVVMYLWGGWLWTALSPAAPVNPYLWISIAIASVGFVGALGSLLLRLEGRVAAFVGLQIVSAVVLVVAATVSLVILHKGLPGLFGAVIVSSGCSAAVLPVILGRRYRLAITPSHISNSVSYAVPFVAGYVAYFVLARLSTLILQRYVSSDQIAIFGLAQQLAMIVTIAATAFGKALQPAVFGAEPPEAEKLLKSSGITLMLVMFCITGVFVIFAPEIVSMVAPRTYASGTPLLLILLIGNFAYSFNLVFNTALLYHKRPGLSSALTISGAVFSAMLALWLIPPYRLYGAASAIAGAFVVLALAGHLITRRVTGQSYFRLMFGALMGASFLAWIVSFLQRAGLSVGAFYSTKAMLALLTISAAYCVLSRQGLSRLWAR